MYDEKWARFIGAFLGDGWVRQNPSIGRIRKDYAVGLAIGRPHEPHTERYLSLLRELFPATNWKNNAPRMLGLTASSKPAHSKIVELGISGYCEDKRLPKTIFDASKGARLAALGGYIDADGHVCCDLKNMSRTHIGSCNIELLNDMRSLAISVGLSVTKIRTYTRKSNICEQVFHQCWVSGLTSQHVPLWHEEKSRRSKLLSNKPGVRRASGRPK